MSWPVYACPGDHLLKAEMGHHLVQNNRLLRICRQQQPVCVLGGGSSGSLITARDFHMLPTQLLDVYRDRLQMTHP